MKRELGKKEIIPPTKVSLQKPEHVLQITTHTFPEVTFQFWLAHGVNYLLSDYEKNIWTPMFESIYQGKLLTPTEINRKLMERFSDMHAWTLSARAALAWTVTDRAVIYVYYKETLRRAQSYYQDDDVDSRIREPQNVIVWSVFNLLKNKLSRGKS